MSVGGTTVGPRQLGGAKPRQILVALLLNPEQALCKASLVRLLWGSSPPAGALSTLEGYVSLLRKRLEGLAPGLENAVRTVPGGYLADLAFLDVDVHRFRTLGLEARSAVAEEAVLTYAGAIEALTGALLPEEDVDWIEEARQELDGELLQVLTDAAAVALQVGDLGRAHRWARAAISIDAYDEPAWRVVLECCERRGLYADGLRAYDECRRLLADELGCTPGPGVREAFGRLLERTRQVDDDPLAALMEAIVRLHLAVSSPAEPTMQPTGPVLDSPDVGSDVEEDWRLLERFLSMARMHTVHPSRLPA
ncbi:hypothetical protein N865_15675 [Intrasporangium oryzae NRRL B-24470]|uniref:OmpR/PhoB-type domain-containing protein n=1 Tax=Intrasporangium oryzae NRRL B-24470 TaxID=1386089 RepID=W9G2U6_9MICO|nr:hypothetical protein N865_15675 [Intrasporangium oryzae NRRL B-24470]